MSERTVKIILAIAVILMIIGFVAIVWVDDVQGQTKKSKEKVKTEKIQEKTKDVQQMKLDSLKIRSDSILKKNKK